MALKFKKGDSVRQLVPVITGTIVEQNITDNEVAYKVEWQNAQGETESRWFKESELEAVL